MRFDVPWGAVRVAVALVIANSQTLAQAPIEKTTGAGATTKFIAIGTLASPGSKPAPSLGLQEEQATLRLYLNGQVEQFWLREDGNGIVLLMSAGTREEVADIVRKLPYAQANVIKFDLIPVGPMMSFVRLLDDGLVHGP